MLTTDQIKARKNHITASDIGAIVGVNPWTTNRDVYRDKCGLSRPVAPNRNMTLGNIMEKPLLEFAVHDLGFDIIYNSSQELYINKNNKLFAATPDAYTKDGINIEVKCVGPNMAKYYNDKVPQYVFCQVQWQMACTGRHKTIVIANPWNSVQYYYIDFSEKLFDELSRIATDFWGYVQRREMPPLPSYYGVEEMISREYPDQKNDEITVDDDDENLYRDLRCMVNIREKTKALKAQEKHIKKSISARIGENYGIRCKEYLCTFKQSVGPAFVNWHAVADELNASDELIEKHTVKKPGNRVLRVKVEK